MTTPPQDEYTSKLAETLERVRKIEEEVIPQMRGEYVGIASPQCHSPKLRDGLVQTVCACSKITPKLV